MTERQFFELNDDVAIPGRWFLKSPRTPGGTYVDPRLFTQGRGVVEAPTPLGLPLRKPGKPLEFTLADSAMPVANSRAASIILRLVPNEVQLIPIKIESVDGPYFIVNVLNTYDCVDEERSVNVRRWTQEDVRPDLIGQYRQIDLLRIEPSHLVTLEMLTCSASKVGKWR